jgi:hypothetical protein
LSSDLPAPVESGSLAHEVSFSFDVFSSIMQVFVWIGFYDQGIHLTSYYG